MRYHFPAFYVCEGTAEDKPCTHGPNGSGMVGLGVMKASDPNTGAVAYQPEPPKDWKPLRIAGRAPQLHVPNREPPHPFASPWVWAAKTGVNQMAFTCPACSEHLKVEDLVVEAKDAAEKGRLQ